LILSRDKDLLGNEVLFFGNKDECVFSSYVNIYKDKVSFLPESFTKKEVKFVQAMREQLLEYFIDCGDIHLSESAVVDGLSFVIVEAITKSFLSGAL